jgi:hypothetical protein
MSFHQIEHELLKRREQAESVRGKDTPFRVEFRYHGGTKHWQYFVTFEDASRAEDSVCSYTPMGRGYVERPRSQQIQARGPRGGWRKERSL